MTGKIEKTVVSGMRPTGKLHLGHFHGAIENWIQLQKDASFKSSYFFVADWHALTTNYDDTAKIKEHTHDIVLDWLSFGLDPDKSVIFVQSSILEHAELHLLLSMITPVSWLERVPSFKDFQKELSGKDLSTHGFLGYPLLQTADVAIYKGTHVPVGQDQVAHIELSREIVRRFNACFKTEVLVEPQALLTKMSKVPGTDGRKMSKSYDNSVYLSDDAETTQKKILPMMTDPARKKRTDPGDPNKCPVFDYHKIYSDKQTQQEVIQGCTSAGIGCVDCKKMLLKGMNLVLEPYREKRREVVKNKNFVNDVIAGGNIQAKKVAVENMRTIRAAMKI